MNLLSVHNLTKRGRDTLLFSDVSFGLEAGEKAALIGRNGTGKSTLLSCIAGAIMPDRGSITAAKNCGVSFLPQTPAADPQRTVRDHILKSESLSLAIIRDYENICAEMARGCSAPAVRERYDELSVLMDKKDLWAFESRIRSVLSVLGISDMEQPMGNLSGGMAKKVALAQVLIDDTQLLLLDEPTNHLDMETVLWLEGYLRTCTKAVLMVTHDRYFLDNVCTSIYELARSRVTLYTGNFSRYLEKKEEEAQIEKNTERRIESVLRSEREWLLRGPKARGTKSRARINRIQRLTDRERLAADMQFAFEVQGRRLGGKILEIDHISKSYSSASGENIPVISDFSYVFRKGEKLGVFGKNGTGKTTLLELLTGRIVPDSGSVVKGNNTVFGYYRQNPLSDIWDACEGAVPTVLEYIRESGENIALKDGKILSAPRFLEYFGFEGKLQHSPVTALSGGELKRLYLVRILISNPNFLVLDEPTNDFDVFTLSALESFLEQYDGCLVAVSHDRCFMDRVTDMLLVFEDGAISGFAGSCSDYLVYLEEIKRSRKGLPENEKKSVKTEISGDAAGKNSAVRQIRKRTFKEQREFELLEAGIADLENMKNEMEARLSDPDTDYMELRLIASAYGELCSDLEQKYMRWEELGMIE